MSTQIDPKPFIDKAYAAIKLQPFGTDEEHARRIGVEIRDVIRAKQILETERFKPLSIKEKRLPRNKRTQSLSREKRDKTKEFILANPKATTKKTMEALGVTYSIVKYARSQLVKSGLR